MFFSCRSKTVYIKRPAQRSSQTAARAGGRDAGLYPTQNDSRSVIVNNDHNAEQGNYIKCKLENYELDDIERDKMTIKLQQRLSQAAGHGPDGTVFYTMQSNAETVFVRNDWNAQAASYI